MKRRLGKVALAVAATLLAFLAAELVLRALGVVPSRYAQPWHAESADKRVAFDAYPDDPRGELDLDLRSAADRAPFEAAGIAIDAGRAERTPHAVGLRFTATLCRGAEPPPDDGRARLLLIGDSFTEGQGVREEGSFAALLASDDRVVINCGRRGYDFPDLYSLFARHLAHEPDVVLYAMTLNDFEQSEAFHSRQRFIDDWIVDRRRMVSEGDGSPPFWQWRLWALIDDRLESLRVGAETTRWYQEMVQAPNAAGWARTQGAIARMHSELHSRGAELLVALWPLLVDLDQDYPFEEVHRAVGDAMRARGVPFVDTLPAFRGQDAASLWVHPSDRHPNARAHGLFAEAVSPRVRELLED